MLKSKRVWDAFIKDLKAPEELKLPDFPNDLLYGLLSETIHYPDLQDIIISDLADPHFKDFYKFVASLSNKKYSEFDYVASHSYNPDK